MQYLEPDIAIAAIGQITQHGNGVRDNIQAFIGDPTLHSLDTPNIQVE